jgi:hypothetical protein
MLVEPESKTSSGPSKSKAGHGLCRVHVGPQQPPLQGELFLLMPKKAVTTSRPATGLEGRHGGQAEVDGAGRLGQWAGRVGHGPGRVGGTAKAGRGGPIGNLKRRPGSIL